MFDYTSMWVQVHDLPIGLLMSVAKDIVFKVGTVDKSTQGGEMFEGCNFPRVRVAVDVSKPLCQGRRITLSNGKES